MTALTPLERASVEAAAQGEPDKAAAARLGVERSTLTHARRRAARKLGAATTAQAVAVWVGRREA